jgi:drug/metabolite transporter (DMT)-like permease
MTRRGLALFAAMSVIWGVPYLLIKVAVEDLSPPVIVAARTGLAALVLVPLAHRRGVLRPALERWRPLLAFTAIEMAGPWLLLTHAEQELPSGLTGLLVATVPLVGTLVAYLLGDHDALRPTRLAGLALGMVGVALLVGFGGEEGSIDLVRVAEVLVVSVGYASAPFIADRALKDVDTMGIVAASLGIVAVVYLPFAVLAAPDEVPGASVLWSVVGLAVLCTGVAFLVFFALIDEIGPSKATLITFVNPAVAVTLGVVVLDEAVTVGLVAGFPLVLAGCALATRGHRVTAEPEVAVP